MQSRLLTFDRLNFLNPFSLLINYMYMYLFTLLKADTTILQREKKQNTYNMSMMNKLDITYYNIRPFVWFLLTNVR